MSLYTDAAADEILKRLQGGETLLQICRDEHLPNRTTVLMWVTDDRQGFADRYARARAAQLEHMADEIVDICDDGTNDWMERQVGDEVVRVADHEHIQRSRLRVDTRKWLLSKLASHTYGDKVGIEHSGSIDTGLGDVASDVAGIFGIAVTVASLPADDPKGSRALVPVKADRGRKARTRPA